MADKKFKLCGFMKDYFLEWVITSRYEKEAVITLKAGETEYFSSTKNAGGDEICHIAKSTGTISTEEPLELIVSVPDEGDESVLCHDEHLEAIISNNGQIIGSVYNCFVRNMSEPHFKGIYINITGWAKI